MNFVLVELQGEWPAWFAERLGKSRIWMDKRTAVPVQASAWYNHQWLKGSQLLLLRSLMLKSFKRAAQRPTFESKWRSVLLLSINLLRLQVAPCPPIILKSDPRGLSLWLHSYRCSCHKLVANGNVRLAAIKYIIVGDHLMISSHFHWRMEPPPVAQLCRARLVCLNYSICDKSKRNIGLPHERVCARSHLTKINNT